MKDILIIVLILYTIGIVIYFLKGKSKGKEVKGIVKEKIEEGGIIQKQKEAKSKERVVVFLEGDEVKYMKPVNADFTFLLSEVENIVKKEEKSNDCEKKIFGDFEKVTNIYKP